MIEPLGPQTLELMEEWRGPGKITIRGAAAEIHELRERVEAYAQQRLEFKAWWELADAVNAKLWKYVQHNANCLTYNRAGAHYCNCGLNTLLEASE